MSEQQTRTLAEIAAEIRQDWTRPYFGAIPYIDAMGALASVRDYFIIDAMGALASVRDYFMLDSGDDIVRYFLANAHAWRGETARRVKAELKAML